MAVAAAGTLAALLALALLPKRRAILVFSGAFLAVLAGFLSLRPSNQRLWRADVTKIPTGELQGDILTLRNVRSCRYRAEEDYDAVFEDRRYDLSRIQGLDFFLVSWGPRHIAHTILSWDFGGGQHLAFSIETRKQMHQQYSAIKGFFREYELCMIAGEEADLIGLRSNYRHEQVRLYRLNTPPEVARDILKAYVARVNSLAVHPEWYNALTENCTTAMISPLRQRSGRLPWSWKLLASGHVDELLYNSGILTRSLPFEVLRDQSLINARAVAGGNGPGFSGRIREGLPPRW